MPYTSEWKGRGYFVKFTGVINNSDVVQASLDMEGDGRFDDLLFTLSDYLDIDGIDYDVDQFTKQIKVHAEINAAASISNPRIKRAIVTTDETVITFANLYLAESGSAKSAWPMKVFSTRAEAENWIRPAD